MTQDEINSLARMKSIEHYKKPRKSFDVVTFVIVVLGVIVFIGLLVAVGNP